MKEHIPAFPYLDLTPNYLETRATQTSGMTLRDYFAAKAMQAQIGRWDLVTGNEDRIAKSAYELADAMLKARNES
jgi:hypothetical protein